MRKLVLLVAALVLPMSAQGVPLILNEWNAVAPTDFLDKNNSDIYFGRVEGNGDNWIELVVTEDHVDIRGWELRWWEDDGDGNGTYVWDATRYTSNESQGKIAFADDQLWSDLRVGTLITIIDKQTVNTKYEDNTSVSFDMSTDASYDPLGGDFWIHISGRDEADDSNPLITTMTNITGDPAGAFSVGNVDWELTIFDGTTDVFGPIGEAYGSFGGINSEEIGKLEADPGPSVTLADYNDGNSSTFGSPNLWDGGSMEQDFTTLRGQVSVPEPNILGLLGTGLLGLVFVRRRRAA